LIFDGEFSEIERHNICFGDVIRKLHPHFGNCFFCFQEFGKRRVPCTPRQLQRRSDTSCLFSLLDSRTARAVMPGEVVEARYPDAFTCFEPRYMPESS